MGGFNNKTGWAIAVGILAFLVAFGLYEVLTGAPAWRFLLRLYQDKALLKATELLGLALGVRLAKIRDSKERLQAAFAEAETNLLLACCFEEACELLALRWDKIPDKRRPQ